MKKLFNISKLIFSVALGLILVASCSSDDDSSTSTQGPNTFNLIEVTNGALNVEVKPTFSWSAATSPDGSPVTYDLYLDTNNPPTTKVASNLTNTIYTVQSNLEYGEIYNWKVVATNSQGSTTSQTASFKTRLATNADLLIGKWFFDSIVNPQDPDPTILTDCFKTSFLQFSGTTMTQVMYDLNTDEDCEITANLQRPYELINNTIIQVTQTDGSLIQIPIISISENTLVIADGSAQLTLKK